jgi:hypothetical protein
MPPAKSRVSVNQHATFRQSLAPADHAARCLNIDGCGRDEIDRELDDCVLIDPYVSGAPSRRSDKELARILNLIDNLPVSERGKEGHA